MDDAIKYIIILALSYLGLFAGVLVSHFTKEELNDGKKYFRMIKYIAFISVLYLFFDSMGLALPVIALCIIFFSVLYYFVEKSLKHINPDMFCYSFFSLALFETRDNNIIVPAMIFIFGLATSSLLSSNLEDSGFSRKLWFSLSGNIIYPVMGILFLIIFRT